jgi:hypothetical protein
MEANQVIPSTDVKSVKGIRVELGIIRSEKYVLIFFRLDRCGEKQ